MARRFKIRRHVAIPGHTSRGTTAPGPERDFQTVGGSIPTGFCLVSFRVAPAGGPCSLQLACLTGPDGEEALLQDFDAPAIGGSFEFLLRVPRGATALRVRAAGEEPAPPIGRIDIRELGTVPLAGALAARWIRRQARQPRRLPAKLANLAGVLGREGVRGAIEWLVASQTTTQAGLTVPPSSSGESAPWERLPILPAPLSKRAFEEAWARELRAFLDSGDVLRLPAAAHPTISIVLVTFNRADLTLACLRAVAEHAPDDAEVVIVDNASSDALPTLLARLDGPSVITNSTNAGFVRACNQAVEKAAGRTILLLNNDAMLLPGSVQAALRTLDGDPSVGAVGAAIVGLEGRLQEAGSAVWGDGSCFGYGRGDRPGKPEYRFRRDTDFVSGAFLLTPRRVWDRLGGFDEAFAPAYYEDVDYCLRARQAGYRVVYEPSAVVVHYEYGSSPDAAAARAAMERNRAVFLRAHGPSIAERPRPRPGAEIAARSAPGRERVLLIDDTVSVAKFGSGFPRAAAILRGLVALGREPTLFPMLPAAMTWDEVYGAVPAEVEVMLGWGRDRLATFLRERRGHFGHVIVSRPHNMAHVNTLLQREPGLLGAAKLVYDAEAIAVRRTILEREVLGNPVPDREAEGLVMGEVALAGRADRVTAVAAEEAELFRRAGATVHALSYGVDAKPTPQPFAERNGFLFVGRLSEARSPNVAGLVWFLDRVWPLLREELSDEGPPDITVAGRLSASPLTEVERPGVRLLGEVEDLVPHFDRARVFVAPVRFSAGIPLKVLDAGAHGVPVVTTELLAGQVGWESERDVLAVPADDPEAFAAACARLYREEGLWDEVRRGALVRIESEWATERFVEALARALGP